MSLARYLHFSKFWSREKLTLSMEVMGAPSSTKNNHDTWFLPLLEGRWYADVSESLRVFIVDVYVAFSVAYVQ
jgi:hypothetical protein